jgi:hypothetical protein
VPSFLKSAGVPLKRGVRRAVVTALAVSSLSVLACTRRQGPLASTVQSRPSAVESQKRWADHRGKHADAIRISEGVTPPELVERANVDRNNPEFKKLRVGIYIFDLVVNERGEVVDPFFFRGPEGGGETYLLNLLARWRYKPALKDGQPVAVFLTITWHFDA